MFIIKDVSKRFGEEYALRDISIEIGKGLNFIIGSSGSGKTTLLKIISGMDPDFEGEVSFCGQDIKAMSAREKSGFYNNVFGFVWQDFNLLDDRTALENILLPQYLKEERDEKGALRVLRELKISELASQKVGTLSGGQKQRVAIARELMKNPQVILADEPTSALDEESSKNIIEILRGLSKSRTVIVVTHDTSLIDSRSKVYELDKGELISQPDCVDDQKKPLRIGRNQLSFGGACALGLTSIRRRCGRAVTTALSILVAATLLLISVSGVLTDSSQSAFDVLYAAYGDSLLDISVYDNFVSAGGTNGEQSDEPNVDVKQDIDGLFEKYRADERVAHVLFAQAFGNIKIKVDGKEYSIETSNNMPVINRLVAGALPMGDGKEIAVPESFVKTMGLTNEKAIGKEIEFSGMVFNWESGEPVETPMGSTVRIVGVVDTTMVTEYGGKTYEYPIGDSFFFNPATLTAMRESANMKPQPGSFYIRCKTPADLISVKDELNAAGIVPLGRFELVEDMVRLSTQTAQQSSSALLVIGILSIVVVFAVTAITGVMRRREFAIFKVSGFSPVHLIKAMFAEILLLTAFSAVLFVVTSPLLNFATTSLWGVDILNAELILSGVLLNIAAGVLSLAVTAIIASRTNVSHCLKTGDR